MISPASFKLRLKILCMKETLPAKVMEKHLEINPFLKLVYTDREKSHYIQDTGHHLQYLAEAIGNEEPILFKEYLIWAKSLFQNLKIPLDTILENLELIKEFLSYEIEAEGDNDLIKSYFDIASTIFKNDEIIITTFIREDNSLRTEANNYLDFVLRGGKKHAFELIMELFYSGVDIKDIYMKIFQPVQLEIGRLWQLNKISVAQEHFTTAATQLIMSQLYPFLFKGHSVGNKILVTCVNGELHELGARMVADFFEMEGWNSYYVGANTPIKSVIQTLELYSIPIIAISATMTFNLNNVVELISSIKGNEKTKHTKIIVGGYPFNLTKTLWKKVGADGCANDAKSAIQIAKSLLQETSD